MTQIELGNIGSKEQVEKLIAKLSGKTYMDLIVSWSIACHNYPVSIITEYPNVTEDELKDMVLFVLACEI